VVGRAQQAREAIGKADRSTSIDRMKSKIAGAEAHNVASLELMQEDSLDDRFAALEREDQIDELLKNLKENQAKTA
jgi:phage shock protein A